MSISLGDETIDLQRKLALVQDLLDASRRVRSTIRLDDVLAIVLEIAAKKLETRGVFGPYNRAAATPHQFNPVLEGAMLPSTEKIVAAVREATQA